MGKSDLSLMLEKLKKAYAFCIFSLPDELNSEIYIQEKPQMDMPSDGFCFSPFTKDSNCSTIYISAKCRRELSDEDLNDLSQVKLPLSFSTIEANSFGDYCKSFAKFHEELISGSELEKLVLSRVMDKPWDGNPMLLFKKLKNRYPENFVYLLSHPESGVWLAASPETLVEISSNTVSTMALAGTKLPNGNEQIHWGEKEIEEHQFVVDYIESTLSNAGCLNINIGERATIKAGKVLHLMTPIDANITASMDWFKLTQDLHPTPAVCGTPKEKARNFILENEKHDRAYYCGFVGPYSKDEVSLFVNLRCMSLFENKVSLFLGGGLTKSSILEDEWKETENKALTLLECLKEI